jgi:subtilisin family serine protease
MKKVAMLVVGLFLMPMLGGVVVPAVAPVVTGWPACFNTGGAIVGDSVTGKLTDTDIASLTPVTPWWVDMVDAYGLDYDGDGVYIAVLDTGLRSNWEIYFDEDRIATEYGKGFSHAIAWDDDEDDFVMGDLDPNRGFITKDIGSGHGTHVSSTILGFRAWSLWAHGVAPKANVIPVLVLDTWLVECPSDATSDYWNTYGPYGGYMRLSGGSDAMVEAGIDYVTDLAEDELSGSKVILSMSLGGSEPTEDIEDALDEAIDAGVIVVAAAGNEGEAGMVWPGAYSQVISCGAVGWSDIYGSYFMSDVPEDLETEDQFGNDWQMFVMPWSSRPKKDLGQKLSDLDVAAPGWPILGPYQRETWWNGASWIKYDDVYGDGTYWWVSGTSMATPHVSATVAVLQEWSQDGDGGDGVDITQKHMERILENAATMTWPPANYKSVSIGSSTYTFDRADWGKGLLQVDEALDAAEDYVDENY